MRTLEQIQADISFLLHEKESFFSKLFHSNSQRIKDLRIDEKKQSTYTYTITTIVTKLYQTKMRLCLETHIGN